MKPATIKLDRKRQFVYNLRALRKLEEAIDMSLFSIFKDDMELEDFSIDLLLKIIWAGMIEHEELTLDEAEAIIPTEGLVPIATECIGLLTATISATKTDGGSKKKGSLQKAS